MTVITGHILTSRWCLHWGRIEVLGCAVALMSNHEHLASTAARLSRPRQNFHDFRPTAHLDAATQMVALHHLSTTTASNKTADTAGIDNHLKVTRPCNIANVAKTELSPVSKHSRQGRSRSRSRSPSLHPSRR